MSRADYDALLESQGGVCAVCGKPSKKTLCVDHCHSTGTIRGLLCRKCNLGLGCLADDQATLIAALAYLGHRTTDRGEFGSAGRCALSARAALFPGPTRTVVLREAHLPFRFGAAPLARGIGGQTPARHPISRGGAVRPTNSIQVQPNGGDMTIDDAPPDGGETIGPMREALDAELRRESDDGDGHKADILHLIARKLAAKALDGDLGAIKEIFDRMDGKSIAGSAPDETPGKVIFQWKDAL
jgi:Recombination endonuclease VII